MESQGSRIIYERRLPKEARREEDDWGGLSEARARRRIQNRLHQRAYRRRRAAEREAKKASDPCRPRKRVSLQEPPSVPQCIGSSSQVTPVSLRSQTVFQQITSAAPTAECAALLSDQRVQRLHRYASAVLWPSFKHYSLETNESLTAAFFRLSLMDELLLNSFIWPAAIAMSMHLPQTSTENNAVMLACQSRALKIIREHINRNDISDSVIFAVLALTISDTNPSLAMQEDAADCSGGFDPPLQSMGWLQYLSRLRWTASHMDALKRLVAARKGLQNITTPGVAEQVQSTDILQASLSLTPPSFTLNRLYQHVLENQMKLIRPPRERIDDVFPAVTDTDFKDLLLDMRMYCRQLERIADGTDNDSLQTLSDTSVSWETNVSRNIIQYRLLCLPRYQDDDEELCRLGALIFSYGVVYPVARRKPMDILVEQLRTALECHRALVFSTATSKSNATKAQLVDGEPVTETELQKSPGAVASGRKSQPEFRLWIAIVGALAAKNTEHEVFFADLTRLLLAEMGLVDFMQLKHLVRKYLWLGKACDTAVFELWTKTKGSRAADIAPVQLEPSQQPVMKPHDVKETYSLICTGCSP
ncbi:hypothetical protein PV04_01530 [Phialophora macrospora]|uniref:BZIP domain-containing protein n=1 Tax=Phialophora macrospora TaxID=1851006 RepID=A0A0D2FY19_9EURO|nr:hypothetical protein PV04_01530 [Phialophora macrospora]